MLHLTDYAQVHQGHQAQTVLQELLEQMVHQALRVLLAQAVLLERQVVKVMLVLLVLLEHQEEMVLLAFHTEGLMLITKYLFLQLVVY